MITFNFRFCSNYAFKRYTVVPKFAVGQTLYRCDLAQIGVLESVTIKEVLLNPINSPRIAIYKDTFNSLNNEFDLCYEADALVLYNQYLAKVQEFCNQRKLYRMCRGLVNKLTA